MTVYENEFNEEFTTLRNEIVGLDLSPEQETTWNISAETMLKENKDFLKEAAEHYGIDGRAIAGAIKWEYELNAKSKLLDSAFYETVLISGKGLPDEGNGWGKMHFSTAQKVLTDSGAEELPSDRMLATMLALPTSAIDLIAKSMRQAVDAYWDIAKENISNDPEILADLYQSSGYKENYETKAAALVVRKLENLEAKEL